MAASIPIRRRGGSPTACIGPRRCSFPNRSAGRIKIGEAIAPEDLVFYELHVGTFTPEGTFAAIIPRLPELASLGVTAIELMPVAQFPGDRNWGYDGVHPNAVQNSYGGPRALQQLVDAAHRAGLAVFLDVVYNHLGPEGNYFGKFGPYFTDRYQTPWGQAINYDGPDSDPVRQFVVDNACQWVRDFHIDGLRLDAVHAIFDLGARHILADIQAAVQAEADLAGRRVHVIAESNQNDVRLVSPVERGGYGLDGVWNDDFHHSVHALLTGERDGYYEDFGQPADLAKAVNDVFVYDGCYSPFRRRRHGSRVGDLDRTRFVVCVQNHDQVGNRAQGDRLSVLVPPAAAAIGVRIVAAFAVRAAAVHGRGIRRAAAVSVLLLVRRSGDDRRGAAWAASGVRRHGVQVGLGNPRSASPRHVQRRQTHMVVARGIAAIATAGNCTRICWPSGGDGKPRWH